MLNSKTMLSPLMNKQFITTIISLLPNFFATRNGALEGASDREMDLEVAFEIRESFEGFRAALEVAYKSAVFPTAG